MTAAKVLLVVEDNPGDVRLLREMINEQAVHNTQIIHAERMTEAEAYLSSHPVDLVLLDLGLADAQGLEAVRRVHGAAPRVPVVVLTGQDDEELASQALQHGAQDYLIKGQVDTRSLHRALRQAVERKIMDEALFMEKERAQVTLRAIADAVASTDLAGNLTFLNRVAETMTGWTWADADGRPATEVLRVLDAATRTALPASFERLAGGPSADRQANCILIKRDGTEIPVEDSIAPIHDREGNVSGTVIVVRDVTVARALAEQLAHSAHHDFLTGLPNRTLLNDRVEHAISIAPRHEKKVALLFLDLDGFKHINDTLGHAIGDKVLHSVAKRLVDCVRASDTVSRQGGDEFVVLLSEISEAEDAAILARRMLEAIAEPHTIDQHELYVTASIGISIFPEDGTQAEVLVKCADAAMYEAKAGGRRSYKFFRPDMNAQAGERQTVEDSLRFALDNGEFTLEYQPQINLWSGQIVGVEALVRWLHPTRGMLPASEFVAIAEACGLVRPIGHWVLREACRQAKDWSDAGLKLPRLAVNISATEFRSNDFAGLVLAILEETGLDPSVLELEVSESVLMWHAAANYAMLAPLRDIGVRLAVDDFGTAYSNLDYLRKFPVDLLKVDRRFVQRIGAGEDTTVVAALLGLGRSLKIPVIAEGVETQQELNFLQVNRCDEAQGHFFSWPLSAQAFARMLRSGILPAMAAHRLETTPERRTAILDTRLVKSERRMNRAF